MIAYALSVVLAVIVIAGATGVAALICVCVSHGVAAHLRGLERVRRAARR